MLRTSLFAFFALAFTVTYASGYDRNVIQERIAPVGKVRLQVAANENKIAQPAQASDDSGKSIYDKYCDTCHKAGLANAPKFRNKADWKPLLTNKNIDDLVATAMKGINAMPAKGTCMDCSKEDIKKAIEYMLPGKK